MCDSVALVEYDVMNGYNDYDEYVKLNENREHFAIQSSQIFMELERLLEKTKKIESYLIQQVRSSVSDVDTFRPDPESCPPQNKRMRKAVINIEEIR